MGVDAEIRAVPNKKLSTQEIAILGYELGAAVGSNHFLIDHSGKYGKPHGPLIECEEDHYDIPGQQILEVRTLHRYYGPGYECGPWPILRAMIVFLQAYNCTVWYGGDSGETLGEVTPEWLANMDKHWCSNGGRPYRDYFKGFNAPTNTPVCKLCGPPLTNCGGGGADNYWYCQGCGYKAITTGDDKEWPMEDGEEFFKVHSEVKNGTRKAD